MKLFKHLRNAIIVTIIAVILGCMLIAAGQLAMRFFYFVMALGYLLHIIGIFAIAFFVVAFIYFIGKECGWWE